jgi:hypothetical protein
MSLMMKRREFITLLGDAARERVLFLALDEQWHFRDLYALTRPAASASGEAVQRTKRFPRDRR